MTYIDIIIILIMLVGLVIGWNGGFFKTALDIFSIFASMVIAGLLKGVVANWLYTVLPFINFEGLYSLNVILYQIIVYFIILLIILLIYNLIMKSTGANDRLSDKSLTASLPSKLIGSAFGIALTIILTYNVILIFKFPLTNISALRESYFAPRIMRRTFMVSNINNALYSSEERATNVISKGKKLKLKNKNKYIDTLILNYFSDVNLISYEKIDDLRERGSLPKYYNPYEITEIEDDNIEEITEEIIEGENANEE